MPDTDGAVSLCRCNIRVDLGSYAFVSSGIAQPNRAGVLRSVRCYSSGRARRPRGESPQWRHDQPRQRLSTLPFHGRRSVPRAMGHGTFLNAGGIAAADYKITDFDGNYRPAIPDRRLHRECQDLPPALKDRFTWQPPDAAASHCAASTSKM